MAYTMQIEFTQAMSDFKIMFPDMDNDVIEAVLRANQGSVDATIDQLLAMSTDNLNEKLRLEIEQEDPKHVVEPKSKLAICNNSGASPKIKSTVPNVSSSIVHSAPPLKQLKNWKPPILGPLPSGFLKLPPSVDNTLACDTDLEDERIAMYLQNEEFMAELRWNQDFLTALDSDQPITESNVAAANRANKKSANIDEDQFRERIKHMGKLSRKKFAQLAKVFHWQGNKKGGGARHGPVTDSLLLQEEHSDDEELKRAK
ncbi:CUE domain-containing protein 1-like [Ctenocephalides felis]|uniref:CUE domain-containing protein 1-like n=1 Tax=Ctenocephalides felis TaxID=7515 RepID=UPI000E6E3797|nr:CUE domain-containing protein 1-like isoform X2 [Ctenocephalides felis]XP_026477265.1 CUE domain-containing protein 1-like [Ctenocephalides felis]